MQNVAKGHKPTFKHVLLRPLERGYAAPHRLFGPIWHDAPRREHLQLLAIDSLGCLSAPA